MSSVRGRADIRAALAREEKPLQKTASDSPNLRHRNPELKGIGENVPAPKQYYMPGAPNFGLSKEEFDRHMAAEAQRQEATRQAAVRKQKAADQKLASETAGQNVNRTLIAGLVADLTIQEVDAIEQHIRHRFPGRENDPECWQFVLDDLRGQQVIEQNARQAFDQIPLDTIAGKTDEQLATFLGCSVGFAAKLREEM